MSSQKMSFIALSCVGFIASAPAEAQRYGTADENRDDDIVVNGQRAQEVDLPKQVAPLIDTPRSIVVIPKDVIEQTGSVSLVEALRTVPGITFGAAEGGNPVGDRPFIRGFDSQGSTYVDGVRDFAAQAREVFAIETIQVVRGSDSALGGRGSPGGTINIVSKMPTNHDFIAATAAYGSADFKRFTIDVNRKLSDTVAFRVEGLCHDQDVAGRDEIWSKRWGVAPSITIGLGTPTRLTAQYYHLDTDELPDTGIPYIYTIGNAPLGENIDPPAIGDVTTIGGRTGRVDRSTYYGLKSRDFRKAKVDQATLRVEHDFGTMTLRNTSRFTHNDQSYIYTQPDDQQGNVFGTSPTGPTTAAGIARGDQVSGGYVWRRANTRYGYADALTNQTDLFGTFATGSIKHSIAIGAEFDWEKARRGAFVLSTGSTISPRCNAATIARFYCTSLFTPNANDPWVNYASDTSTAVAPITRTTAPAETQNDGITRSVYAFDSITIVPSLILNLGGRYDWFKSIIRPGQAATATQQIQFERTDGIFNWQAGLVLKPTKSTSVYASYATSASPPNSLLGEGLEGNALPTTATPTSNALLDSLKPEKTRSYEVGAKADLFNGRLNLTAAAFRTEIKNARVLDENNNPQFGGERRIQGVELGVNGEILPGWTAFGGYTHLDPKIIDGGFQTLTAAAIVTGTTIVQPARTIAVPSVNNGRQATQTAKDSFTAWTNATFFKRLQIGGGAFYTSRVYGGYTDNRSAVQNAAGVVTVVPATKTILRAIPSYWRFDARAALEITPRINLSVNVLNITNKTYFTQAYQAHFATIAPGRSAFATLAIRY